MKKQGFTSYSNDHIYCPCLPDELYRLKAVLEAHMGISGSCVVMIKTLAKEVGKHPKTVSRELKRLSQLSNLEATMQGKIYRFSTIGNAHVTYGRTPVSPIMPHACPLIKRLIKKEEIKNLQRDVFETYKEKELTPREREVVEKVVEWNTRAIFNTALAPGVVRQQVERTVGHYGAESVWRVFDDIANKGYSPHPKDFWNAIKDLKLKRI